MNHDEHDDDIYYDSYLDARPLPLTHPARDDFWFRVTHEVVVKRTVMEYLEKHGIADYPNECCGFVFGEMGVSRVKNINSYKRGAYKMHPQGMAAVLMHAESKGLPLRIIYHSHPGMGAFFSSIDRMDATSINEGEPDWSPETAYIVMSIKRARYGYLNEQAEVSDKDRFHRWQETFLADARAYQWNPAIKDFSEITLKVVE